MSGRIVETELAPGLVRWTIDHPRKRNALTPAMLEWLRARAGALAGEVVLLDASPGPCFCAGFDLDALPEGQIDPTVAPDEPLIAASAALQSADAVLIAALRGEVIGAGVELACACDLRIAAGDVRFTVPAARLGVVYHPRGVALLRSVFGPALARRLLLAADSVGAEEALRAGVLAELTGADALPDAALRLAGRVRQGAPRPLRAHRDLLRALDRGGLTGEAADAYAEARRAAYGGEDYREGRAAARERRPPRFTGR